MKSNVDIRRETRGILAKGWFGRMFVSGVSLYGIVVVVMGIIVAVIRDMEMQTWSEFLQTKMAHLMQGMDYAVPSKVVALEMSGATLFQEFFSYLFGAIVMFAALLAGWKKYVKDGDLSL